MPTFPAPPSRSFVVGSLFWALLGVGWAAPDATVAVESLGGVDLTSLTWPGALVTFGMLLRTTATTLSTAVSKFQPTLVVEHRYADKKSVNEPDSDTSE